MWDRSVSCGTEQSHVGQTSLMWVRAVLCGTEYHMGHSSLMWVWPVLCGTEQFFWERAVSSGSMYPYVEQNSLMWVSLMWIKSNIILLNFTSPGMSCKLQNIFLWFLKVSWIAWKSNIIFLKFDKSWNVLQASIYFSMIFKSLLDCQKVTRKLSWSLTSARMSYKLQIIFLWFLKVSWIVRSSNIIFLKFDMSWNVLKDSKYFPMIFKSLLNYQKVQENFWWS